MNKTASIIFAITFLFISIFSASADEFNYIHLPPLPSYIPGFLATSIESSKNILIFFGGGSGEEPASFIFSINSWSKLEVPSPSPRTNAVLVENPEENEAVLFGGRNPEGILLQDTWSFQGNSWKQTSSSGPSPRAGANAAYCALIKSVILFGGAGAESRQMDDTWAWSNKRWKRLETTRFPSGRLKPAMVSLDNGSVLLFGGNTIRENEVVDLNDTWLFDGVQWRPITSAISPSPRSGAILLSDGQGGAILIGGLSGAVQQQDIWHWIDNRWLPMDGRAPTGMPGEYYLLQSKTAKGFLFISVPISIETNSNPDLLGDPESYLCDTQIFSNGSWRQFTISPNPGPRTYPAMAYDPNRRKVVLFGGLSSTGEQLSDTWEFDGQRWIKCTPSNSPPARFDHRLTFDPNVGGVLLFGGAGNNAAGRKRFSDTWVFDGHDWRKLSPTYSPQARSRHILSYLPSFGKTVCLCGQSDEGGILGDIWEFDGAEWHLLFVEGGPGPLASASYSSIKDGRLIITNGASTGGPLRQTWSFDGRKWGLANTASSMAGRLDAAMAPYGNGAVVFGGFDGVNDLNETWFFDGTNWGKLEIKSTPLARSYAGISEDPLSRIVMFGGYGSNKTKVESKSEGPQTYFFDGSSFTYIKTKHKPKAEISFGMAYDQKRKTVVLFGGYNETLGELNETYEFDGQDWKQIKTAHSPSPRGNPSLIYDPKEKRIILFGGYSQDQRLSDLWVYDGKDWSSLKISNMPTSSLTGGASMVWDNHKKRFVIYGARPKKKN